VATMEDIAKRAGVSLSTVSYVLSGKRPISEATKQRVRAVIEEFDFHPHEIGRALARKRSNTIALLYPTGSYGLAEISLEIILAAVEEAASRAFSVLISTSLPEEAEVLRLIRNGFIDGLVLMEVRLHDARAELLKERRFPFTMIGHCACNDGLSFVDVDFEEAAVVAVRHLFDLGHRRIACLTRRQLMADVDYGPSVRTAAGFEREVTKLGMHGQILACDPTSEDGIRVVDELLSVDPEVTAIITVNSEALGAISRAVQERGLRIPHDFSLVAITSSHTAEFLTPPLTSLDFPAAELGRLGTRMLIDQLEKGGDNEPTQHLLRAPLSIRRSSGPARTRERISVET
jgi:DNA-binding LacI/PurR family transcriptional regulator